ncbi:peptidase [Herbaspirillum seropedicae]|nr:peptidase [Herbaspirillum seropedicae]
MVREKSLRDNPIAHIGYQPSDLSAVEVNGGGGAKELVPVTPELRRFLRRTIEKAALEIERESSLHPDIPGILIFRLRDIAVAKSHRPLTIAAEAEMTPVGHGAMDEMLVTATQVNLSKLDRVVATRNVKAVRANISAVERFEPWGLKRRFPLQWREMSKKELWQAVILSERRLKIRLFRYSSVEQRTHVLNKFRALLRENHIQYEEFSHSAGIPIFFVETNKKFTQERFLLLASFPAIRRIEPEPLVWPHASTRGTRQHVTFTALQPSADLPVVAVFDTGVDPLTAILNPWIVKRDTYILPPDTDYVHGTAVGSLLVDSAGLNLNHTLIPSSPCRVHDVCALEVPGSRIGDLIIRLREAVAKASDVKIWNLSLGANEVSDEEFTEFGRELDALSDAHGVLFVVAAGNYVDLPRRSWPVTNNTLSDRLSSPGDSVRAITVGAVAHLENASSLVKIGEPAPYSRRGPGPLFTPKPDLAHLGGNADHNLDATGVGLNVLSPGGAIATLCGTSFATPIISALAAHTWRQLEGGARKHRFTVTPNIVKALLVHSAEINSPERSATEKRYFGSGTPLDPLSVLYDSNSSFTMMFELDITESTKWRKSPFPIPPSLFKAGKLNCEVIITAAYAPVLDPNAGAEYVRVNVDVGFGLLEPDATGKIQFKGQVPAKGELGTTGHEQAQVEYGGKWSPIKIYRRSFPNGKSGTNWALQATLLKRALEPRLAKPVRVIIIVTLRALDNNPNIYEEGQRALAATNWIREPLPARTPITVRNP